MDLYALTVGSTLYLPVFQPGALFYVGDPHGLQGDGEVSGNALEQSLSGVFQFVLHKGKTIDGPRAEIPHTLHPCGHRLALNRAMRMAVLEVVNFLVKEKGIHARQSVLAGQHCRRLPRRGSGGWHAACPRLDSQECLSVRSEPVRKKAEHKVRPCQRLLL